MNIDELKERLQTEFKQLWDRVQDSSLYNQLRDRYENLSPRKQRLVIVGFAALISFLILSVPFSYWSEASLNVTAFEDRRDLVRRLLSASREAADVPEIPMAPAMEQAKVDVDSYLQELQLLPEQIKSVEVGAVNSSLIPTNLTKGGLTVQLNKLNIRQIIDIGYKLKSLSPSVKMTSLQINPNREDARYFNVVYQLLALAVPQAPPPAMEEPPTSGAGKRPTFRRNRDTPSTSEETSDE